MIFFKIVFINFIIFNIELVENYNYRFSHKTLSIATMFSCMIFFAFGFFFCYDFFKKIFFVHFIFLILIWLRIYLCNFFLENIVDCNSFSPYKFFYFFHKFIITHKHVTSPRHHAGMTSSKYLDYLFRVMMKMFLKLFLY